ncbi:CoA-binding protein [Paracoccus kondratievae]|uniref:acetate--CoA ligase family protein n=1 Tax=Paracoccus kondratievae TaxID=135740 RepID=UPI0012667D0A|nr:acetate--CoA ligase family protein [Paracoccus kondratievae]QFQ88510.1 CoA-binding protein [Paracoccus kondratievae]
MERLLRPQSIAVVGGGSWCANIVRECRKIGFTGPIWPVHPSRDQIEGVKAYPSVQSLPFPPDAAFVGVNREATIPVVAALAQMKAGGAVCFAAGFSEAAAELPDGADLQQRLIAAAAEMPFLGPNCYGFINALDGAALWPDQHGAVRIDRGVAIITQSSNIAINLTMQRRGVPVGYVVTVGNQARTGLPEVGEALLRDPRVTALGLHIEGIGNLTAFEAMAATARRLGKRIVALKVGASEQARVATVSHTASLAGSDAAGRALLGRLGISQVSSLSALLETLKIFHVAGSLSGARIASMSCSGGEASLIADAGLAAGVEFPPLGPEQRRTLGQALGPRVALSNPLDYNTYIWGDSDALTDCFRAMADPELAMSCVVLDFPRPDRCATQEWDRVLGAFAASRHGSRAPDLPLALISSIPDTMSEEVALCCLAHNIVPLCGIPEAMEAIAAAALPSLRNAPDPLWDPGPDPVAEELLPEAEAKAQLAAHGIRTPVSCRVNGAHEAVSVARELGFPVVLKGEGFAHKTEAGAVAINLRSAEDVQEAATRINAASYLVEEMVTGAVAELIIGITRDRPHGWMLTLGAGGVLTELLQDSVSLLLPVSAEEVEGALHRLRIWPLLEGWRGGQGANIGSIIAAVMALQSYVRATSGLIEAEINPLICRTGDAVAVDALIRRGKQ